MTYLDLFSGIGGFSLGFERAGWKFDKHYFSEIDKYATQIYKKHFPTAVELGSITGVKGSELGEIDLITFGFPCQDLSVAGKRSGLTGARSGLFFEATRLIRECHPRTFIFENVAGLLTSNEGQDFEVVLREIADIWLYECEWQLLNTSWFLPQNRERVYFIGHLAGAGGGKVFPVGENDKIHHERRMGLYNSQAVSLRATDYKGTHNLIELTKDKSQGYRVYDTDGISTTIAGEAGGVGAKTGLYAIPVLTPDRKEKRQNGRRMKNNGEPSFTLTGQDLHGIYNGQRIRRLTPTECCRLQGFPDDWVDGISDSQKYRCLGNAVTVDVVAEIARRLLNQNIESVG